MSTTTDTQPQGGEPTAPEGDALTELETALGQDEPEGGQPAEEWQPPTREEWEAERKAREAAEGKLKRARTQAKNLRERQAGGGQQAAEDGTPAPAADPETERWRGVAVRQAAKSALLSRGADTDMVDLAVSRLRIAEVEVDADGEPELEDWLDEMEERYPKLFAKGAPTAPAVRTPVGGVNQGKAAARPVAQPPANIGAQIIANSETARTAQMRRR
jgi:hypothetical protein